ncbi:hypothetical protein C2G38_2165242 [Gigaspora rosea]|uniref:Kelch-like protein 17 n=1 Tax=Gigaspora rosea TaxID=44941 RepID=A0A397VVF6_9GLOM|nr:hypothetical protein C2G38_2165242 [Gigaspora rosea]
MVIKFFEQLSQDLTQLLENEYEYNVIIEVGEQPNIQLFKGHSAILYQRSLYFRQNFVNAIKNNNIIEIKLPHISPKLFNIIIKYIYGGIVSLENFEVSTIFDLLVAANELKFTELVRHIQSHLIDNNASWLRLKFSRVYQISFLDESFGPLQQFCNNIITNHPSIIFNSDEFTSLHEDALIALLKNDDLQMDEPEIWGKVIQWGKAKTPNLPPNLDEWTDENFKTLKATLQHCLPHIRYLQISGKDILKKIKPYQDILEKKLWDDIVSKFLDPDTPITSPILPPRKKEKAQLPPPKALIITPSSSIITLQHIAEISSWIDRRSTIYDTAEIPYEFNLLLRGSRDGFTSDVFHSLCDNIPGTVVVVKINSTNEILGGYNPLIWNSGNEYATTADSFIFSLKNGILKESILSRVKDTSRAIRYYNSPLGPWFGSSAFGMRDDMNCLKKLHCGENGYEKQVAKTQGWVIFDEYEVFQICKNKNQHKRLQRKLFAFHITKERDRTGISVQQILSQGLTHLLESEYDYNVINEAGEQTNIQYERDTGWLCYNPLIWKFLNSRLEYATTADSFIFFLKNGCLNESILSRVKNTSEAILYYNISYGPWFSCDDVGI